MKRIVIAFSFLLLGMPAFAQVPEMNGLDFVIEANQYDGKKVRINDCHIAKAKPVLLGCVIFNDKGKSIAVIGIDGESLQKKDMKKALQNCADSQIPEICVVDIIGIVRRFEDTKIIIYKTEIIWKNN